MPTAYTRVDARRTIALEARDLILCTHTGASSTTVCTDRLNLLEDDNQYVGCWGVIVTALNAANAGHVFRVLASDQATASITIVPAAPAALAVGDTFDLHNLMGKGIRPTDLYETIGSVVADLESDYLIPATIEFADRYAAHLGVLPVPEGIEWGYRLEWCGHDGRWIEVPPRYWRADPANAQVELLGQFRNELDGFALRIFGLGPHPAVDSDDAPIVVDRTYLKWMTLATIARRRTGSKEWLQNAAIWNQAAERARVNLDWVRQANARRVR